MSALACVNLRDGISHTHLISSSGCLTCISVWTYLRLSQCYQLLNGVYITNNLELFADAYLELRSLHRIKEYLDVSLENKLPRFPKLMVLSDQHFGANVRRTFKRQTLMPKRE